MAVEVRVLGSVELVRDGEVVSLPEKQRRLLAALAAAPGEAISDDRLVDAIWAEAPPASANALLQVYVSQLRKALGEVRTVVRRGRGYSLELSEAHRLDAAAFERLLEEADLAVAAGAAARAAGLLGDGFALWHGRAYGDYAGQDFARAEAARLEELRIAARERWLEARLSAGEDVTADALALVADHPLREGPHRVAMLALYRSGRQSEALDLYRTLRSRLIEELGLEPSPETRDLEAQILRHDRSLLLAIPAGKRRWPPLPAAPNRLIGREQELADLRTLLSDPDVRLVTLTGAGGTGKTRVALEAAREAASNFAAGAAFVSLAAVREPARLSGAVADALGVELAPELDPWRAVALELQEEELLLVLDNVEQLRDAAAGFAKLLAAVPRLKLLLTSRIVLHLSGEHIYPVDPLPLDAAAHLFQERVREADPLTPPDSDEDTTIRQICERLDRLPLAIEIAASRMRALTAAELLQRLDPLLPLLSGGPRDLPERQRTVRATLEWGYQLLDQHQQRNFARLAVFAGGSTLEAAEAICDSSIEQLSALVDQHLVTRTITAGSSRFDMLETIHEFAREQLDRSGEEGVMRRRHADHYRALAEAAAPEIERGRPQAGLERLSIEHDNLRAALDTLEALEDTQGLLALAGALWPFWMVRGHAREARHWLERVLVRDPHPTRARARALIAAAQLTAVAGTSDKGDLETARRRAEEAMQIFAQTDDRSGAALARWVLAWIVEREGDWVSALDLFRASVDAFRELGDDHFVLAGETHRAFLYEQLGEHPKARTLHDVNLRRARSLGNDRVAAHALGALAMYAVADGNLDDGWDKLVEAYAIHKRFGFAAFLSVDLMRFAAILVRLGEVDTAAQLAARSARLAEDLTALDEPQTARERDETTALIRTQLEEEALAEAWSRGRELSLDDAFSLALDRAGSESRRRLRQHDSGPRNAPPRDTDASINSLEGRASSPERN